MFSRGVRAAAIAAAASGGIIFGAAAVSSHAAGSANGDPSCATSTPCITYSNTASGAGVLSTSATGNGLGGKTMQPSTSTTSGRAGIVGTDASASGFEDFGVEGISTRGTGVEGKSTQGIGVHGISTNSTAVEGVTTIGIGVDGSSTNGDGVAGFSTKSDGVVGQTTSTSAFSAGIQGTNNSTAIAVRANGFGGLLFDGNNHAGADVFTVDDAGDLNLGHEFSSGSDDNTAFAVEGRGTSEAIVGIGLTNTSTAIAATAVSGGTMYVATNSGDVETLLADDSGNLTITGDIFTAGFCSSGCAVSPKDPGARVVSYAPHEAAPTMEDTGEAQLIDGAATVRIDRTFASVIDQRANYVVLITPEGDSRGLYVTAKTPTSFVVRENEGGRSTLAFAYRIVAKPFGPTRPRLARVSSMRGLQLPSLHAIAIKQKSSR